MMRSCCTLEAVVVGSCRQHVARLAHTQTTCSGLFKTTALCLSDRVQYHQQPQGLIVCNTYLQHKHLQ